MKWVALALALLATGPAVAVTLVEPTATTAGAPLTAPGNALWACAYWIDGQIHPYWLQPTAPAGGGSHALLTPTLLAELPRRYVARCLNAQGWGPEATGTLELRLTAP